MVPNPKLWCRDKFPTSHATGIRFDPRQSRKFLVLSGTIIRRDRGAESQILVPGTNYTRVKSKIPLEYISCEGTCKPTVDSDTSIG